MTTLANEKKLLGKNALLSKTLFLLYKLFLSGIWELLLLLVFFAVARTTTEIVYCMDSLQDPVFIDFFAREQLPAEDTGAGSNEDVPFPGPSRPAPRPTFTDPRASRPGPSTSNHPPAFPTPKLAIPKDPRKGLASFPEPERQDPEQEIHTEYAVQLDQILAHVEALGRTQKDKFWVQEGQAAILNSIRDWRSSQRKEIIKDLKERGVNSGVFQALLWKARSQYGETTQGKNESFIKSGKLFDQIFKPK